MWLYCCGKVGLVMVTRRSRGEGALFWHEGRQRWVAVVDIGLPRKGKRRRSYVSAKTKTRQGRSCWRCGETRPTGFRPSDGYTVREAVESWLRYGLAGRDQSTMKNRRILAEQAHHPVPWRAAAADLSAEEVDAWLAEKLARCQTDTVHRLLSILRAVDPTGTGARPRASQCRPACDRRRARRVGRPSRLTLDQAAAVWLRLTGTPMHAYVVVSLLTGARTEELRALTWVPSGPGRAILRHRGVAIGAGAAVTPRPGSRDARSNCRIDALRCCGHHGRATGADRLAAASVGRTTILCSRTAGGYRLDAANVRRAFRRVARRCWPGRQEWTPRELRHQLRVAAVQPGVPIEDISHLVGHASTRVTEMVYRKELRPVLTRARGRWMRSSMDGEQAIRQAVRLRRHGSSQRNHSGELA